jgi:hypothetical protein
LLALNGWINRSIFALEIYIVISEKRVGRIMALFRNSRLLPPARGVPYWEHSIPEDINR